MGKTDRYYILRRLISGYFVRPGLLRQPVGKGRTGGRAYRLVGGLLQAFTFLSKAQ